MPFNLNTVHAKYIFTTVKWIILFTTISFLFVVNAYHPGSGSSNFGNFLISIFFVIAWFLVSVWSGYNKYSFILIAAMVYSLYPVCALFPYNVYNNTIFELLLWGWCYPVAGFSYFYDIRTTIMYVLMVLLPAIYLLGYYIGVNYRSSKEQSDIG